jgi:ABC-2 type transport system permease protein
VSLRNTARAFPAMLRVGFHEAVAYRAEMIVWVLATTMPLVMLALWSAVAREAPVGRFDQAGFVAYFLATFIVRQLTGSWVSWQMNYEIREGTLSIRLVRPVHPLFGYAAEAVAYTPLRLLVSIPVAAVALWAVGAGQLAHDPAIWAMWALSVLGAWLVTLLVNLVIGCFAFFVESSTKVMEVWLALYFVFSGYLVPIELFPPRMRAAIDLLPFRYQIGLPVELMTGAHDRASSLRLLGGQWAWVLVMLLVVALVWRRGIARFSAYGG